MPEQAKPICVLERPKRSGQLSGTLLHNPTSFSFEDERGPSVGKGTTSLRQMSAGLGPWGPHDRLSNSASRKRSPCHWNKSLHGRVGLIESLRQRRVLRNDCKMTEGEQDSKRRPSHARRPKSNKPTLSPEIQKRIGRQLQDLYVGLVQQGVPNRFTELLRRLDAAGASSE
jgi:hypothetical protein